MMNVLMGGNVYVCIYQVCVYVHVYMCTYLDEHTHMTILYVYMYICVDVGYIQYVYMHVCIYAYVHETLPNFERYKNVTFRTGQEFLIGQSKHLIANKR